MSTELNNAIERQDLSNFAQKIFYKSKLVNEN